MDASSFRGLNLNTTLAHCDAVGRRRPLHHNCTPSNNELGILIERHIKKRALGTFTLPGLLRIARVRTPPRKARTMISPRTGEEIQVAAKPASTAVKVRVLAGLKQMVE